jgi:hypothetical protein
LLSGIAESEESFLDPSVPQTSLYDPSKQPAVSTAQQASLRQRRSPHDVIGDPYP